MDTAKQEASNVAGTAKDEAKHVARTAKDEAKEVGREARTQISRLYDETRMELSDQAAHRQDRLAQGLRSASTSCTAWPRPAPTGASPPTSSVRPPIA